MSKFKTTGQYLLAVTTTVLMAGCGGGNSNKPPAAPAEKKLSVSNFLAADYVMGQPNFISDTDPNEPNGSNLYEIYASTHYSNGILYVSDYGYNRILGFNSLPATDNPTADFVLGQVDYTSDSTGTLANEFDGVQSPFVSGNKLFVTDYNNNRALIFDPAPTTGPATASIVVGQSDFGESLNYCAASGLNRPETLTVSGSKLIITDSGNNRVLIWNSIPTSSGQEADLVLGQADLTSCNENRGDVTAANTFAYPAGVWTDGNRLAVIDSENNRVLIWNTFPTSNGQDADLVLGQNNFESSTENDDDQNGSSDETPSARTLSYPYDGIDSDGNTLFVTDSDNNRVLVWKNWPTENFQPADAVIGQSGFTHNIENDDDQDGSSDATPSQRTLNAPYGLTLAQNRYLLVDDNRNYRILVFDLKK